MQKNNISNFDQKILPNQTLFNIKSTSKDNNQFIIQLNSNLNKGLQKFIIKIDDEEVGELEINIKKGGMEEEDYGALFG